MPKNLITWINEIKTNLEAKGYTKNIPTTVFKAEFMILSGYGKDKVNEWFENFKMCKLIEEKEGKVIFQMTSSHPIEIGGILYV